MSHKFSTLIRAFKGLIEESIKNCGVETEKLRRLIVDGSKLFIKIPPLDAYSVPLMSLRVSELYRVSIHILYLSLSGLYRNAFENIRYVIESVVQSLFIDSRHPRSSLRTRIEILKEIEDKIPYHAVRLIDKLEIDHKQTLRREYKKLSKIIHPSHRSVLDIMHDMQADKKIIGSVNCKEISNVYTSLKIMFDITLFLYISYAQKGLKEQLRKDSEFIKFCKTYSLPLLSKILKV
jgi:hypothetical protein